MPENILTKIFHLGKKAYSIPAGDSEIILFGKTDWDRTNGKCQLQLICKVVPSGTAISLETMPARAKVLFTYGARSTKFVQGEFTDFDARRYIKSRYREFTRELNRHSTPEQKIQLIDQRVHQHEQEQRNQTRRRRTSAQTGQDTLPVLTGENSRNRLEDIILEEIRTEHDNEIRTKREDNETVENIFAGLEEE